MQPINRVAISVALGVALFGTPVRAADNLQVAGLWKLVSFHTEDVVTKARGAYYGEQPMGFIKLETNGDLSAWTASGWPMEAVGSMREDLAASLRPHSGYRAVFYSGKYRLDERKFIIDIDEERKFIVDIERAQHGRVVGTAPFGLTWNEGVTHTEDARRLRVETGPNERAI